MKKSFCCVLVLSYFSLGLITSIYGVIDDRILNLIHGDVSFSEIQFRALNFNDIDENGNTPLHIAVQKKKPKSVASIIKNKPDLINKQNRGGQAPLHIAVINKSHDLITLLLSEKKDEKKADVNIRNISKETSLHIAANNLDLKSVELLVDNGADVNAANGAPLTPLMVALVPQGYTKKKETDIRAIVTFLINHGAKVYIEGWRGTPLHFAAEYDYPDIAQLFIHHVAVQKPANKQAFIDAQRSSDQKIALHLAVEKEHADIIKILIADGANLYKKTKYQHPWVAHAIHYVEQTPYQMVEDSRRSEQRDIAKLLKAAMDKQPEDKAPKVDPSADPIEEIKAPEEPKKEEPKKVEVEVVVEPVPSPSSTRVVTVEVKEEENPTPTTGLQDLSVALGILKAKLVDLAEQLSNRIKMVPSDKIEVTIGVFSGTKTCPYGTKFKIVIAPDATISNLKEKIMEYDNDLQVDKQRLIFDGARLEDNNKTLAEYGIKDGAEVSVMIILLTIMTNE